MSVFKVTLQQGAQGALDKNPSTMSAGDVTGMGLGTPFTTSLQRQVYVMGPNKINRLLSDGATFTDCNYWKQFAYPQTSLDKAFITVLTDDGSTYVNGVVGTAPVVLTQTIPAGDTMTVNFVTGVVSGTGFTPSVTALGTSAPATFCQIENLNGTNNAANAIQVALNGGSASFTLQATTSQIFNSGDLTVNQIVFNNSASGAPSIQVQIIAAVSSVCNS
jgi:hypothetical protein